MAALLIALLLAAADLQDQPPSMEALVREYSTDRSDLQRFHDLRGSDHRLERLRKFQRGWVERLDAADFESLPRDGQVDWLLLRNFVEHELRDLGDQEKRNAETREVLPFADRILALEEARRRLESVDPVEAAKEMKALHEAIAAVQEGLKEDEGPPGPVLANRAAGAADALRRALRDWFRHSDGYDPGFSWWVREPYQEVEQALRALAEQLRKEVAGLKGEDDDPLIGDPIGREALLSDLAFERIPYGPEGLVAIAEEEFAWCEAEMLRASRQMGHGEDWKAALESVKEDWVDPGAQDELVAGIAAEAIEFLDRRELVTIPALCRETWRVEMVPAEDQRIWPYGFYGGQHMAVAYPTGGMEHVAKLEALRGNNVHFVRNVTPHELVPGHHLQGYMGRRFRTHRGLFHTPFLGEGWALYWEFRFYDLGWPRGPEDRIGMLFWRMHRCARVIVSLRFHLGEMSTGEMIDFLVDRVGHERDGATGEVRRYVGGGYGPLYQCAYLIGGIQMRALHKELVEGGAMSERQFHDAVLQQNSIPIALIRAALTSKPLSREPAPWAFAGERP